MTPIPSLDIPSLTLYHPHIWMNISIYSIAISEACDITLSIAATTVTAATVVTATASAAAIAAILSITAHSAMNL